MLLSVIMFTYQVEIQSKPKTNRNTLLLSSTLLWNPYYNQFILYRYVLNEWVELSYTYLNINNFPYIFNINFMLCHIIKSILLLYIYKTHTLDTWNPRAPTNCLWQKCWSQLSRLSMVLDTFHNLTRRSINCWMYL